MPQIYRKDSKKFVGADAHIRPSSFDTFQNNPGTMWASSPTTGEPPTAIRRGIMPRAGFMNGGMNRRFRHRFPETASRHTDLKTGGQWPPLQPFSLNLPKRQKMKSIHTANLFRRPAVGAGLCGRVDLTARLPGKCKKL